jgi:hypothetical protein
MSRASADPTVHPAPPVVLPRLSVLAPEAPVAPKASVAEEEAPKATSIGLGLAQAPSTATESASATGWSPTAWRIGRRS